MNRTVSSYQLESDRSNIGLMSNGNDKYDLRPRRSELSRKWDEPASRGRFTRTVVVPVECLGVSEKAIPIEKTEVARENNDKNGNF